MAFVVSGMTCAMAVSHGTARVANSVAETPAVRIMAAPWENPANTLASKRHRTSVIMKAVGIVSAMVGVVVGKLLD
jgi:hypothetical protein